MREAVDAYPNCPIVEILETGPRYDAQTLRTAFPHKAQRTEPGALALNVAVNEKYLEIQIPRAVDHFSVHERDLWQGIWKGHKDLLTGKERFPSQSEADLYLTRQIARHGQEIFVSAAGLPVFVEKVFEQSALALRRKWRDRPDYRASTVEKACSKSTPAAAPISPLFGKSDTAQPDWSLKGDLIAARFFRDQHAGNFVFIPARDRWLRWDEGIQQWLWCDLREEVKAAKQTVLELYREACRRAAGDPDNGRKLVSEMAGLQREPRIRAVLELAKSEQGISRKAEELNAHPELLGVKNGVVNLRTGSLQPNDPSLFITKYIDIDYIDTEQCPAFQQFLNDVFKGDAATIDAVQRLAGLTLTGCTGAEIIIFCVGTGANGKSIFGNAMSSIMGAYAVAAPSTLLAARRSDDHGPRSDLAMLHGARLVSINELPGGMTLDETVVKQLAGREPISARFLHKEFFSFLPSFTPWVRTNHRPIIKGTDDGIWRRLVIVPFRRTFKPAEQDPALERKLRAEQEGILAWMIEGAHIYLQSGLQHSRVMKAELAQYRTDSDLLGAFLSERTVAAITADVLQSTLFSDYQMWCGNNGLRPVSKRTFTEQLSERGYGQRKSGGDRFYTGLEQRR